MLRSESTSKSTPSTSSSQPQDTADHPACYADTHNIATSTTNTIAGHRTIRNLGTIFGLTVRSRNWASNIGAGLKSAAGGELRVFTTMLYRARNEAMDRMVGECMGRGGNAVIGVRFDVASEGVWSQVCAYGTAVVVEKIGSGEESERKVEEGDEVVSGEVDV